ncbi:MAG: hypothetical protein HN580_29090 [Deltaproteobacteria bacterium]|jgi:quinol monooxygenase YgiN|nr:hypothetical protein [Deltaproteobacteria bacterium]MBT4644773.1 hypothetical protein [Deltaproteobacteria bacterium]MBT6501416.1 hypothetical protein [Deltaproteobacteria bacterium]MBT7715029.1 hypothetical protein [Deltaproteobacteria bacterium]MBT7893099.1 hypothetical protein [Deltaproteobacteria bacterium]
MEGILIQYEYSGDESQWQETVKEFVTNVKNDSQLTGKFFYSVFKTSEPNKRVHVGRWDSNQTLETLKQRDFFKKFTESMQNLAGDSLTSIRLQPEVETVQ